MTVYQYRLVNCDKCTILITEETGCVGQGSSLSSVSVNLKLF